MKVPTFVGILLFVIACSSPKSAPTTKPARTLDSLEMSLFCQTLGGQFYDEDRNDSALFWYRRATEYNRNNKHAWHGVAISLGRLGRHDESMPAFAEALRVDSNYVGAIWHRACGHAINLDKADALADLRRAIALDSTVKQGAQEDKCFEWLWTDKEFLEVVR